MTTSSKFNREDWEDIISSVDKAEIPLRFVASVDLNFYYPASSFNNATSYHLDMDELLNVYQDIDDVLKYLDRTLNAEADNIKSAQFNVDVRMVAEIAQEHTDEILRKLQ